MLEANSSYGVTADSEAGREGREREREGGRRREGGGERETPNAALFMKHAHIFRTERDASSDHTASVRGDVRATRRQQDESMRAIISAHLMEDGARLLGLRNWRLVPLLGRDVLHLNVAVHSVVSLVVCS